MDNGYGKYSYSGQTNVLPPSNNSSVSDQPLLVSIEDMTEIIQVLKEHTQKIRDSWEQSIPKAIS